MAPNQLLLLVYAVLALQVDKAHFFLWHNQPQVPRQCLQGTISDRFWPLQWYLHRSPTLNLYVYNMNVLPAWKKCYNGTGVVVAVVDSGVSPNPELSIDDSLSHVFSPTNHNRYSEHGTNVAGIIAAKLNGMYGVGIAFGAKISNLQVLTGQQTPQQVADAIQYRSEDIDVYSCSFADFESGFTTYPLSSQMLSALTKGTNTGRHGKGSVYVVSSGNGGGNFPGDSCAYFGFMNNRFVIPVVGIQHNLQRLDVGENCSAILVAAFSKSSNDAQTYIISTGVNNPISFDFALTSAAVPMVSGAVALAIQANPRLSYRDVMHLLTQTSTSNYSVSSFQSTFKCNAAGFRVSHSFGFGVLNIGELVTLAEKWEPVGRLMTCTATQMSKYGKSAVLSFQQCQIGFLEHVKVEFTIRSPTAGHDRVVLTSQGGTRSVILAGRKFDKSTTMDISVVSVHFWGESSVGIWTISSSSIYTSWISVRLTAYGISQQPKYHVRGGCNQLTHGFVTSTSWHLGIQAYDTHRSGSSRVKLFYTFIVFCVIFYTL